MQFEDTCEDTREDTRKEMKDYWNRFKHLTSVEGMLLDEDASTICDDDTKEILGHLPDYNNTCILELAAGIGRFTGILAERAQHIIAVDFVKDYIEQNRVSNIHRTNCEFVCADVLQYDYPQSMDMVFSCWILMYLNNEEVVTLFKKAIQCLKPGGFFYFRESCYGNYHQLYNGEERTIENREVGEVGSLDFSNNPTRYRSPEDYETMLQQLTIDGYTFRQENKWNNATYTEQRNSCNQICYLYKKCKVINERDE